MYTFTKKTANYIASGYANPDDGSVVVQHVRGVSNNPSGTQTKRYARDVLSEVQAEIGYRPALRNQNISHS